MIFFSFFLTYANLLVIYKVQTVQCKVKSILCEENEVWKTTTDFVVNKKALLFFIDAIMY